MNDVERWINLEGPEPEGIRELLDAARQAAREVPEMSPELEAELDRSIAVALAAQRRGWARARRLKVGLAVGAGAAAAGAVGVLVLRAGALAGAGLASEAMPNALMRDQAEPSVSATARAPDAGAASQRGSRR